MGSTTAIKPDRKEYTVFAVVNDEGVITSSKFVSTTKQLEIHRANPKYKEIGTTTVAGVKFGTVEGFLEAVKNDDARLDVVNKGTSNKTSMVLRSLLLDLNDDATDFTYDFAGTEVLEILPYLQEGPKSPRLTQIEKLQKQFEEMGLPQSDINEMIAKIIAAQALQSASAQAEQEEEDVEEEVEA
jgi:hypothetical protein